MKKKETLHIYTRVSTRIQEDDGTSLDTQREYGIKKAQELGMHYEVHNEGSQSSKYEDLHNRPVLEQLEKDILNGLVKHLFVIDNDRLSRNKMVHHRINYALEKHSAVLYTRNGQFNLDNEDQVLYKSFEDIFSQHENIKRTNRSRIGKIKKTKEQNTWIGGHPPFGYKLVDKKLVTHPVESNWVRRMFEWYYDGKSVMWIKSQLDTNGVRARRGGLFTDGSINKLLQNTHPIGYYKWTDKKSGETIPCSCPSIIDETIWKECQVRRKKEYARKGQNNRTKQFYLLRNLLVCEECGSQMSGRIYKPANNYLYFCPSKTRNWKKGALAEDKKWKRGKVGEHGCTMVRSLNIPITDKFVWNTVMDTISNSSILKENFKNEVLQSKYKGDAENERLISNQKKRTQRLEKELKQVRSSLSQVEAKNELGEYEEEEIYVGIKSILVEKLNKVKDDIEQTRIRTKELGNQKKWLDWVEKYGDHLRLKGDLSKEDKQKFLLNTVEEIGVSLDKETNDHHLTINFRMGLVTDGIQYADETSKSGGYELIEGDKQRDMVISKDQVHQMHQSARVSKKKADGSLLDQVTIYPRNSVTVE